jgi:hypothetical protein
VLEVLGDDDSARAEAQRLASEKKSMMAVWESRRIAGRKQSDQ